MAATRSEMITVEKSVINHLVSLQQEKIKQIDQTITAIQTEIKRQEGVLSGYRLTKAWNYDVTSETVVAQRQKKEIEEKNKTSVEAELKQLNDRTIPPSLEAEYHKEKKRLLSLPNEKGETLLHQAIKNHDIGLVEAILAYQPEWIRSLGGKPGKQLFPIHYAAKVGALDILKYFLTKGISPNEKCPRGRTLLHYAARNNQAAIFRFLESCSAFEMAFALLHQDQKKQTPLHLAAKGNHKEAMEWLLIKEPKSAWITDQKQLWPVMQNKSDKVFLTDLMNKTMSTLSFSVETKEMETSESALSIFKETEQAIAHCGKNLVDGLLIPVNKKLHTLRIVYDAQQENGIKCVAFIPENKKEAVKVFFLGIEMQDDQLDLVRTLRAYELTEWSVRTKEIITQVMPFLLTVEPDAMRPLMFMGQGMGGADAQIAVYDLMKSREKVPPLSLITHNAFRGIEKEMCANAKELVNSKKISIECDHIMDNGCPVPLVGKDSYLLESEARIHLFSETSEMIACLKDLEKIELDIKIAAQEVNHSNLQIENELKSVSKKEKNTIPFEKRESETEKDLVSLLEQNEDLKNKLEGLESKKKQLKHQLSIEENKAFIRNANLSSESIPLSRQLPLSLLQNMEVDFDEKKLSLVKTPETYADYGAKSGITVATNVARLFGGDGTAIKKVGAMVGWIGGSIAGKVIGDPAAEVKIPPTTENFFQINWEKMNKPVLSSEFKTSLGSVFEEKKSAQPRGMRSKTKWIPIPSEFKYSMTDVPSIPSVGRFLEEKKLLLEYRQREEEKEKSQIKDLWALLSHFDGYCGLLRLNEKSLEFSRENLYRALKTLQVISNTKKSNLLDVVSRQLEDSLIKLNVNSQKMREQIDEKKRVGLTFSDVSFVTTIPEKLLLTFVVAFSKMDIEKMNINDIHTCFMRTPLLHPDNLEEVKMKKRQILFGGILSAVAAGSNLIKQDDVKETSSPEALIILLKLIKKRLSENPGIENDSDINQLFYLALKDEMDINEDRLHFIYEKLRQSEESLIEKEKIVSVPPLIPEEKLIKTESDLKKFVRNIDFKFSKSDDFIILETKKLILHMLSYLQANKNIPADQHEDIVSNLRPFLEVLDKSHELPVIAKTLSDMVDMFKAKYPAKKAGGSVMEYLQAYSAALMKKYLSAHTFATSYFSNK